MNKFWIPLFAAFSLCGCAVEDSKLPVEVSVYEAQDVYSRSISKIVISAVADSVQIEKVTVNRSNNCGIHFWYRQWSGSGSLKFGQGVTGETSCGMDSIKEVEVETDTGNYTFTF